MTLRPLDPSEAFAELGRIRLEDHDLRGVLNRVAELAKQTFPGAADVSVTLIQGEDPHTAAFTGPLALELDETQYQRGYGPCLDAAVSANLVSIPDMSTETRYPQFTARAIAAGVASSLSVGLPLQEALVGALNIYGDQPGAFDHAAEVAQGFASYAAVAVANAHLYEKTATLTEHMRRAMATRAVIEQAKGIIMAQQNCTSQQAFDILTKASQTSNRKLRDVASSLVERYEGAA